MVLSRLEFSTVQQLSRRHNLLLFGDLQCSSQVGSISRFRIFHYYVPMSGASLGFKGQRYRIRKVE